MNTKTYSLAACSVLALTCGTGAAFAQQEALTMWIYGDCTPDACLTQDLVDGFEAANPGITIEIVEQPGDSYYTSLLAASITGTGPDIAQMWPGGYMTAYKQYMENIHDYVPAEDIAESIGTDYFSEGNNSDNVTYGAPTENQWYTGFYNKAIFAANGITAVPTTWAELTAVCETLKAAGVLPIIQGPGDSGAQFQPIFEFSYMATAMPIDEWNGLYDGSIPYSNPVLQSQLEKWAALHEAGCVNEDAYNHPNTQQAFADGEAAMYFSSGSWAIPDLSNNMGEDLGIMIPPFSDEPIQAIISTAGSAAVMMTYSEHKEAAGKYLAYILSDEGQQILANITAPTRSGFTSTIPQINELVAISTDPTKQNYPMFDNFTQPGVTDTLYRNLPLVLIGEMTAADALASVDAAFAALPEEQKAVDIGLSGN